MTLKKEEKEKYFLKLKQSAGSLLWEYDLNELSNGEIKELLIERVMEYGDMKQIQLLMKISSFKELALYFYHEGWKNFSNINFNFWFYILKDCNIREINWSQLLRKRRLVRNKYIAWKH